MQPAPGTLVTDNIRLLRLLGEGGMGSVWVAEHLGLDIEVAVKFISAELARKNPSLTTRFKREAGIAARIRSPHVVQTFDHGITPDGTPYIAMELMHGESLEDRLERVTLFNMRQTALVVSQTAQVLGRAHKLGIVHRDIKPDNLFLEDSDYEIFIKVLDFGIAKHVDAVKEVSVTSTGMMLGSPQYMCPEQFTSAKGVDGRADLWSLAAVAYRALTGRPPFPGETIGHVMMAVMQGQYEPARSIRPDLPPAVDAFFSRAFAAQLEQRFQSAEEMAAAFLAMSQDALDTGAHAALPTFDRPSQPGRTITLDEMAPAKTALGVPAHLHATGAEHARVSQVGPPHGTFAPAYQTLGDAPKRSKGGLIAAVAGVGVLCAAAAAVIVLGGGDGDTAARPAVTASDEGESTPTPTPSPESASESSAATSNEDPSPSARGESPPPSADASAEQAAAKPSPPPAPRGASQPHEQAKPGKPGKPGTQPEQAPAPGPRPAPRPKPKEENFGF